MSKADDDCDSSSADDSAAGTRHAEPSSKTNKLISRIVETFQHPKWRHTGANFWLACAGLIDVAAGSVVTDKFPLSAFVNSTMACMKRIETPFQLELKRFDFSASSACLMFRPAIFAVQPRTMRIADHDSLIKLANLLGPEIRFDGSVSEQRMATIDLMRPFVALLNPLEGDLSKIFDNDDVFVSLKHTVLLNLPDTAALSSRMPMLMLDIEKLDSDNAIDNMYALIKDATFRAQAVAQCHDSAVQPPPRHTTQSPRSRVWCDNHQWCAHTTAECRGSKRGAGAQSRRPKQARMSEAHLPSQQQHEELDRYR